MFPILNVLCRFALFFGQFTSKRSAVATENMKKGIQKKHYFVSRTACKHTMVK